MTATIASCTSLRALVAVLFISSGDVEHGARLAVGHHEANASHDDEARNHHPGDGCGALYEFNHKSEARTGVEEDEPDEDLPVLIAETRW